MTGDATLAILKENVAKVLIYDISIVLECIYHSRLVKIISIDFFKNLFVGLGIFGHSF